MFKMILKPRRRASRQRGAALMVTMTMLSILAVSSVALMSMSASESRIALRANSKNQTTSLAEAGVHAMFSQVTQTLRAGSSTMPTIGTTTLYSTFDGKQYNDGTYSATVISDPYTRTAVGGNSTGYIDTYTVTAEGTGTSTDGKTQSKVRATFTVSARESEVVGSGTGFTFPDQALVSNGNILLQGSAATHSLVTLHGAGASANGVVSNNGNAYSIDGPISAAPSSYAATLAALGSSPNDYGNTVTQLPSPVTFPDSATVSTWQSTWSSESQETGTTYPSGHTINSAYSASGNVTLKCPCYINGDLTISHSANLTLAQDAGASKPYILYVNGNVNFATGGCTLTNNGVLIVCTGVFSCGKNSTYSCTDTVNGGLVSLSTSSNAISLTAGSSETIGECYAVNGGIFLGGNATMTGAVVSGQTGATGGISLQGNPTVNYPVGLNNTFKGLPPSDYWAVTQQYTPTSPMNWVQTL